MADQVAVSVNQPRRRPLLKSTRFYVLKRDGFACRYCGRKAPDVVLECDHKIPVSRGGGDDPDNLITACQECNAGKFTNPLPLQHQTNPRPNFPGQSYRLFEPELSRSNGDYFDAVRAFSPIVIPNAVAEMCISPAAKFYYGLLLKYAKWDNDAFVVAAGTTDSVLCQAYGSGKYFAELVKAGLIVADPKTDPQFPGRFFFVFTLDFV